MLRRLRKTIWGSRTHSDRSNPRDSHLLTGLISVEGVFCPHYNGKLGVPLPATTLLSGTPLMELSSHADSQEKESSEVLSLRSVPLKMQKSNIT